jgi:two-component system cell cycle sensor histidine kinase/response regulator CckA
MEASSSWELVKAVVLALDVAVIVIDADGNTVAINAPARARLGADLDDAIAAASACARGEEHAPRPGLHVRVLHGSDGTRRGCIATPTAGADAAALERANMFLDSIVDNIPDMIFVKDVEHLRFERVNRAGELLVGHTRAELLGKTDFDFFPHDQAAFFQAKDRETIAGGHVVDIPEEPIDTPDGKRWLHTKKIPLLDEQGVPRYLLGISADITERKLVEDELVKIKDELEGRVEERTTALRRAEDHLRQAQKLEAVGRLAGGVAHDFNNLLTVIMAQASVAGRESGNPGNVRAAIDGILDAARRAANLTRQLLVFSRQQVVQPRRLDLARAVSDLMPTLGRVIGEHITLRIAPPHGGAAWIDADPGQLEQVILNLVVNARDAMPDGGELDVAVSHRRVTGDEPAEAPPGNYAVLTVKDSGMGMDVETVARIFEPFFTTKAQGRGTGLGLATVYGIVTAGGGTIRVDTAPGRGATFDVYFPAASPGTADESRGAHPKGGSETLLLVEDDALVRESLAHTLHGVGYNVVEAADGAAALRVLDSVSGTVHAIITDVVMPIMGGRELARRARLVVPEVCVLFISGHAPNVMEDGFGAGEAFLAKPFEPAALLRRVRELLDAKAQGPL